MLNDTRVAPFLIPADNQPHADDAMSNRGATMKVYSRKMSSFSMQHWKTTFEQQALPSGVSDLNAIQQSYGEKSIAGKQCSHEARLALSRLVHLALPLLLSPVLSLFPAARITRRLTQQVQKCSLRAFKRHSIPARSRRVKEKWEY